MAEAKTCTQCEQEKPLEAFPKDARYRDGRSSWCRLCANAVRTADHRRWNKLVSATDAYSLAARDHGLLSRLLEKVEICEDPDGCWRWTGGTARGYAKTNYKSRGLLIHRLSLIISTNRNPVGQDAGHLCHDLSVLEGACTGGASCRHRQCVNPDHLEWQSPKTNVLNGGSFTGMNARKTHCRAGHPLGEENAFLSSSAKGWRQCRACVRERHALRKAAAAALGLSVNEYQRRYGRSTAVAESVLARLEAA